MEWIEVAAKSVDEAKELALDRLGVVEAELEFEVIEEPRTGLLGRFSRSEARIRARVKPVSREKPGDRRQRRRGGRGDRPANGGAAAPRNEERKPSPSSNRRRRGRSGPRESSPGATRSSKPTEADDVNEATIPIEEQAQAAARFTQELVGHFGLSATVDAKVVEDDINVDVDGEGLGVLVGPRGVTLQALEELTRAVLQHIAGGYSARLHLDVGGYRERRRAALAEFALGIAADVIESGTERALEPMHAPDRKVVHDAVATLDGVATTSEGEEPRRRVVIRPA